MLRLTLCCAVLLGVSGCALLEGQLTIDQAVARLVPNDPPSAADPDRYIGENEILTATQLWINGQPVPRTGGQRITEGVMNQLILLWRTQALIP